MKKTNNNNGQSNATAIFNEAKGVTTYAKPSTKVEQAQPKYSDIKRGILTLADEELRSFGQCLKALKAVQNVPAFAEMLNADALTMEDFTIDFLRDNLPFRFNANDDLCRLVVLADVNRDKYAGFETYDSNGKTVARVPCKAWAISTFYNLFKSARRAQLRKVKEAEKARKEAHKVAEKARRLEARRAELKKGKEAEKARKEAKKAEQLRRRLALQRSRLEAREAKLAQMNAGKSE